MRKNIISGIIFILFISGFVIKGVAAEEEGGDGQSGKQPDGENEQKRLH